MDGAQYIDVFTAVKAGASGSDGLQLPKWGRAEWQKLLSHADARPFRTSEVVIQRGATERALYLVAGGSLEVGITQVDGVSIATLARIAPGSVIGEQSFFDGQPRSANVWAVSDGVLLALGYDPFVAFSESEPALARDFLFALARVLSLRLRNTTFRVRR
jgi:CRP/FNR family transcriptional regulator, cyclic AMP receptor protein